MPQALHGRAMLLSNCKAGPFPPARQGSRVLQGVKVTGEAREQDWTALTQTSERHESAGHAFVHRHHRQKVRQFEFPVGHQSDLALIGTALGNEVVIGLHEVLGHAVWAKRLRCGAGGILVQDVFLLGHREPLQILRRERGGLAG